MSNRELTYNSVNDVVADLERLKHGHHQQGNWTLAQASWHCRLAIENCLKEIPADAQSTPEQIEARKNRLEPMLAANKMPPGRPMPPGTDPFKDAPQPLTDGDIDNFIVDLKKLEGSQLKHVIFGPMGVISIDQFRRFIQIHSANHMCHFTFAG